MWDPGFTPGTSSPAPVPLSDPSPAPAEGCGECGQSDSRAFLFEILLLRVTRGMCPQLMKGDVLPASPGHGSGFRSGPGCGAGRGPGSAPLENGGERAEGAASA